MQNTSTSNNISAFDEHDCAGRLATTMRLLAPELRAFIQRCVTTYLETTATQAQLASTASAKKKKKKRATPSTHALEPATTSVTANVHGSVDFAADLKFVEMHWGLYFEPSVGNYASELRVAVAAAAVCRNKVAHQGSITPTEWTDWCDALCALAVFVGASTEVKRKLRSLTVDAQHVSTSEFDKRIREVHDALKTLEDAQVESFERMCGDLVDDVKEALANRALKDEQIHTARAAQAAANLERVYKSLWSHTNAGFARAEELSDAHTRLARQLQTKVDDLKTKVYNLPVDIFDRFEREAAHKKRQEQLEQDQASALASASCHWLFWIVAVLVVVAAAAGTREPPMKH